MQILKRVLVLSLMVVSSSLLAQPVLETGGSKTKACVPSSTGLISFHTMDKDRILQRLSFPDKSFLSIKIDGEIYTNSDKPPAPAKPLGTATSVRIGDTLITAWWLPKLTLTQRIFPKYTEHGMRIAVSFSANNKTSAPVKVETQYLLDAQVLNDGGPYYEMFNGVNDFWRKYADSIPTHFIMTSRDIRHSFPGILDMIGLLSLTDSLPATLKPSMVIAGNWPDLERLPFVDTSFKVPALYINDLALLLHWKDATIAASSSAVLGGFSYGGADFQFCDNNVLMVIPDTLAVPVFPRSNILRLPVYVINQNGSSVTIPAMTFNATGVASFEGGERSITVPVGYIQATSAKGIELKITYDSIAELQPQSVGSISTANCGKSILFLSNVPDTVAPVIGVYSQESRDCHRRVDTMFVSEEAGSGGALTGLTIQPQNYWLKYLTGMVFPSTWQSVIFTVLDTMQDARALIATVDKAGNRSTMELSYCTTPDTLAPRVMTSELLNGTWTIVAHDGRPWDRMLDKIETTARNNVTTNIPNDLRGTPDATATVTIIDSARPAGFCVVVYDIAGNTTQKECYSYTPVSSVEEDASIIAASISPNPATDHITLTLPSSRAHDITITDILGRVVWSGRASETQLTINTTRFKAGKYVIRVQGDGGVVSVPMMIVR